MPRAIQVHTLSSDFRAATRIVEVPAPQPRAGEVVVRTKYLGINASDVNFTAGKYMPDVRPPFLAGFEAVGVVEAAGAGVGLAVGTPVAVTGYGVFAELVCVKESACFPLPAPVREALPLLVSGLTASIGLEVGQLHDGETVLVTAAAGATGMFAVQLAKQQGCTVIGTCSSDAKCDFLRSLGCDRPVNYKKESLKGVLRDEFPRGVDVVYECVGGEMYRTALGALATRGRVVVIGMIAGYQDQTAWTGGAGASAGGGGPPLEAKLLGKSQCVRGMFLNNYTQHWPRHIARLTELSMQGKLAPGVDDARFYGLEGVADALDHMYAGGNRGKVVVDMEGPRSRL